MSWLYVIFTFSFIIFKFSLKDLYKKDVLILQSRKTVVFVKTTEALLAFIMVLRVGVSEKSKSFCSKLFMGALTTSNKHSTFQDM